MNYDAFLAEKVNFRSDVGFDITDDEIHPMLFPHQRAIVRWALKLGRRGRTVELNPQYFMDGVRYLQAEEERLAMPTLFDLRDLEETVEVAS